MRCNVLWSQEAEGVACFYVTAFASSKDLFDAMVLNVEEDQIQKQIVENLKFGLQEVAPHEPQPDAEVMLLAGGPSLNDFPDEIYERAKARMPAVTVNGAYNWALAHRIRPAATVVLDGREFNRRFVDPVIPGCKYLLSSQCHPELVKSLPKEQVWLWHSGSAPRVREAIDQWCTETGVHREWYPVFGGSTVVLRAIVLLRMLGFTKLHVYGFTRPGSSSSRPVCVRGPRDGGPFLHGDLSGPIARRLLAQQCIGSPMPHTGNATATDR